MIDNKIMIKFYAFIFIVCAFLTYIVDLNGQIHFFKLDSLFLPITQQSRLLIFLIKSQSKTNWK